MTDDPYRAAAFYRAVRDVPTEAVDIGPDEPPATVSGNALSSLNVAS